MSTTTNVSTLKINYLTQSQYDTALSNNLINENEIYLTQTEDMTPQEVDDFVDSLNIQGESLYELCELDTYAYATLSVYNCTGTISHNQLDFLRTKGGEIIVQGRVNINSFVRTATNPGVNITLPSFIPTPTVTREFIIGFRAQSPREGAVFRVEAGSRTAFLKTLESYANAPNGTLTFIVSGRIFVK